MPLTLPFEVLISVHVQRSINTRKMDLCFIKRRYPIISQTMLLANSVMETGLGSKLKWGFFSYQIEMTRPTKVLIHLTIRREPGTEREKGWPHSAVFNIEKQKA